MLLIVARTFSAIQEKISAASQGCDTSFVCLKSGLIREWRRDEGASYESFLNGI
jgi:hypothetical protein